MRAIRAEQLLALPIRLRGIPLGRAVDLLLDQEGLRVLGLDVLCGDDVHRFLPLPTVVIEDDELTIGSPLLLLEPDELAFYRSRAVALESLRGRAIDHDGRAAGVLKDVVVGPGGVVAEVIVEANGQEQRLPFDETVRFQPVSRSAA